MSRLMHMMIISKHPLSGTLYAGLSAMAFESSVFRMIIFYSVWILPLKNNQIIKKNTQIDPNQPIPVRFGSGFWGKTGKTYSYYGYSYNVVIGLYLGSVLFIFDLLVFTMWLSSKDW